MRETPLRRACLPPAGRYYPYANGSLWPPLSFVNDASPSSSTIHRRENRLWCCELSHSFQWRPGRTTDRHNIPRSACRLRTAADRLRWLCGRRSAGQPATGSRALAVVGGGGTASTLPGRGAHRRRRRRGFPICAAATILVQKYVSRRRPFLRVSYPCTLYG